jgi:hypothetical protein
MSHRVSSLVKRGALLCAAAVPFALLSGCAMTSSGPSDSTISDVSGVVHGGQSPIQGASVVLYVTSVSLPGYYHAGVPIGTATTDANGNFTISPSATSSNCPAGQYAYISSAGGYPSGSPALANNSTLMVAALGACANISSSTHVVINEVTTVAAAYALSGFMGTTANGAIYQANVGASGSDNAVTGTSTQAAGLGHAFLNAANLANYVTGTANSQTANITVGTTTVNGSVPLAEINSLGDILQACVNGATGNSSCVKLFADTPSISGVAPINTLQAMIYLARNPASAAAMNGTTGLFSIVPSGGAAFQPQLAAAPPDWSLAIVYISATPLPAQYFIALDANDTAYAGASGSANLAALSAYGISTPTYTAGSLGTATRQIAPDALGNVWVTGYKTSATTTNVYQYSAASGGAPTATYPITNASGSEVYGVAVDKSNNVWVASAATATPNITELAYSAGSYSANYTATVPSSFQPVAVTIDANQNIWAAPYYTNATIAMVLPNLTPASTATYTTSGTTVTPVSATFASGAIKPLGLAIDASGNAWYGSTGSNSVTTTGVEEVEPVLTSSVITSLSPQSLVANATLGAYSTGLPGIDGAGTVYLSDNESTTDSTPLGIHAYSTVAVTGNTSQVLSPPSGYQGCYLATSSTTTCGLVNAAQSYPAAVYNARGALADSTGSVWAGITSGGFTQFIGLAAPSWPLLATGRPGQHPGDGTATPLP